MAKKPVDITEELRSIGVELLEPFSTSKTPTKMKCIKCGNEYINTPCSVKQSYKKYNSNNCKVCAIITNREKHIESADVVNVLAENNINLCEEYKGVLKQHEMVCGICNYEFQAIPSVKIELIKKGKKPCTNCSKSAHVRQRYVNMNDQLLDIKIKLLEPYKTRFDTHKMQCTLCGNKFESIPSVRLQVYKDYNLKGCPDCVKQAKAIQALSKDNLSHPIHQQLNEAGFRLLQPFTTVKEHYNTECLLCGDIINVTPIAKLHQFKEHGLRGCPKCTAKIRYSDIRKKNLQRLADRGIKVLDPTYDGSHGSCSTKIYVQNMKCGHSFYASTINLLNAEIECSICGPSKRTYALTAWSKLNSERWKETASEWQKYKSEVKLLTETAYKRYEQYINPHNYQRGVAGNEGAYQLDHIVPVRFCFEQNIPQSICADYTNLQMLPWEQNVGSSNCIKGSFPAIFYDYIKYDDKQKHYAKQLQYVFEQFKTHVNVCGHIATLQDPETKFSIFVVPIDQMHGNQKIAYNIHQTMTKNKIPFLILFEDELNEKFNLIISKIKHRVGINSVESIHARKCNIRIIDNRTEYGTFLDLNHIQGKGPANITYGAYYNDELVGVMSFSHPRLTVGGGSSPKDSWELVRFATSINYRIPGIATKLLEAFKRNNIWSEIYTFVDKRTGSGITYEHMGMVKIKESDPSAYYVIDGYRRNVWGFTKERIQRLVPNYDANITDFQNMSNAGFWRVWDAGHTRYVLVNN